MKTSKVKCHATSSSENALCIIDAMGHEAYIPDQFVLKIYYHAATKEVCAITMPTWLAIDRGLNYDV